MSESNAAFTPDWVSPPGDTISDLLNERAWTQVEFARRIDFTTKHVNQLIKGDAAITEDAALRLERVLGGSARFWMNRESQYRVALAEKRELESLRSQRSWLKVLPINEMVKEEWISRRPSPEEQVRECLKFFGVASVDAWENWTESLTRTAYRMSAKSSPSVGAVAAWLRKGELRASGIECEPFDRSRLMDTLSELRGLTQEADPRVFVPRLTELCAGAGVAVVFQKAPKGVPVSGATRWLSPSKALLMLTLRFASNDHLWFSMFHEAGHLALHGKKLLFLEEAGLDAEAEHEANVFAADLLIPPAHLSEMRELGANKAQVIGFANRIGIAPGIVVGRMHRERIIDWKFLNGLKVRYHWG